MGMQVDEPGRYCVPFGIDLAGAFAFDNTHSNNGVIVYRNVANERRCASTVDDKTAPYNEIVCHELTPELDDKS
jgi:hypothetical protein